tara:strand:+ start:356 stop:520 length:165 start_codon:yes stop_codon:yes gene_type:complete
MEITEEMLDAIEKVKGKRKASLWDNRTLEYFKKANNINKESKSEEIAEKATEIS